MSTYVPITTVTLSTAASEIVLSGIPQIYTDLVIEGSLGSDDGTFNRGLRVQFNGDTSAVYSRTGIYGETSVVSYRETNQTLLGTIEIPTSSNGFAGLMMNVLNYSSSIVNKSVIIEGGAPTNLITMIAGLWRNTSPITSIRFFTSGQNIRAGSTVSIYGVASGNAKATGGEIYISGSTAYHVFRQSGVFTPLANLTADILVIGGGGGGGASSASAGGGGAGGVVVHASQSLLANTTYSAVVGSGGRGALYASSLAQILSSNGSNSQFALLTAAVGGGRGASDGQAGGNGGSGGGGSTNGGAGGTGTAGQGFAGAAAGVGGIFPAGGGGGAGSAASGQNGGSSVNTYTGWGSFADMTTATGLGVSGAFAGGGGGGSNGGGAGSGGGGGATASAAAGQSPAVSSNATINTGSGAGGGSNSGGYNVTQGAGGSGVIVVRYTL